MRAVIACIADKGLDRTSVADIRRKAGVSTGTLYVHFKNKSDLVAAALRYASMRDDMVPKTWREMLELLTSPSGQLGFDLTTVARTRLHLHAECALPGDLHDAYRPVLESVLATMASQLRLFEQRGEVRLAMAPDLTARAIGALVDGLLMIALETDQPLKELQPDLLTAISCLVEDRT